MAQPGLQASMPLAPKPGDKVVSGLQLTMCYDKGYTRKAYFYVGMSISAVLMWGLPLTMESVNWLLLWSSIQH